MLMNFREMCKKTKKTSMMVLCTYVYVFFFNSSFDRQFSAIARKKHMMFFKDYACVKQKTIIGVFFCFFCICPL